MTRTQTKLKDSGDAMLNQGSSLSRCKILIVDDHPIVRHGLAGLIGQQADMEVCGQASNMRQALQQAEAVTPDLAIVDISLEGASGFELIEQMKAQWPQIKVLVSSIHDERTFAGRALRAGAAGYISKRETPPKIVDAVRHVMRGDIYLSPAMTTRLLQRAAVGEPLDRDPAQVLSNRELQVFEMIGQGLTTTQIAAQLQVSPKTVESHRKQIKEKLNVPTSAQLSRYAFQWVTEQQPGAGGNVG
jgi:DNA-binding NarL/FixJ family response regulator